MDDRPKSRHGANCWEHLTIDLRAIALDECGQDIVEAAIVLPILFLILLAIFWFGRAFNIGSTIDRAAREGIKAVSRPSCATCGNTFQPNSQVVTQISNVLSADNLNIGNVKSYSPPFACNVTPAPSCTTLQNVEICTGVPLTCGNVACQTPAPGACGSNPALGSRVAFAYETPSPLSIANLPPLRIRATAQSGPEN